MKKTGLLLLVFFCTALLQAQETTRLFSAGAEASLGMAGIADFSTGNRNYGPILGWQAGLFTSRYFCEPAYFELGIYGALRGNRIRSVSVSTPGEMDMYPSYRLWYLDLPLRLYFRVGKSRDWESFLFMGFTTSYLVDWEARLASGQEATSQATPDDFNYSLSYGLAFGHGAVRLKIYANMALRSLSQNSRDVYGMAYVPFEILASAAYILK